MDLSRTGQPNPSPVLDSLCASKRMAAFCQAQVHLSKSQPNRTDLKFTGSIHQDISSMLPSHIKPILAELPCAKLLLVLGPRSGAEAGEGFQFFQ